MSQANVDRNSPIDANNTELLKDIPLGKMNSKGPAHCSGWSWVQPGWKLCEATKLVAPVRMIKMSFSPLKLCKNRCGKAVEEMSVMHPVMQNKLKQLCGPLKFNSMQLQIMTIQLTPNFPRKWEGFLSSSTRQHAALMNYLTLWTTHCDPLSWIRRIPIWLLLIFPEA